MRLTLRLLLNWINQNLSETDAAQVAQKIEESEVAKTLRNQLLEVLTFPNLSAPTPLDGTPKGNANAAAEYLDNAMDPQTTPEFEKFCVHSEVALGEIASCHRILSRALTRNLELPPELRSKLCKLYKFIDANDESSIPHLSQKQQAIQEELPEKNEEDFFDELDEETESSTSVPAESASRSEEIEQSSFYSWKTATIVLLAVDVIYIIGRLAGFLP